MVAKKLLLMRLAIKRKAGRCGATVCARRRASSAPPLRLLQARGIFWNLRPVANSAFGDLHVILETVGLVADTHPLDWARHLPSAFRRSQATPRARRMLLQCPDREVYGIAMGRWRPFGALLFCLARLGLVQRDIDLLGGQRALLDHDVIDG